MGWLLYMKWHSSNYIFQHIKLPFCYKGSRPLDTRCIVNHSRFNIPLFAYKVILSKHKHKNSSKRLLDPVLRAMNNDRNKHWIWKHIQKQVKTHIVVQCILNLKIQIHSNACLFWCSIETYNRISQLTLQNFTILLQYAHNIFAWRLSTPASVVNVTVLVVWVKYSLSFNVILPDAGHKSCICILTL